MMHPGLTRDRAVDGKRCFACRKLLPLTAFYRNCKRSVSRLLLQGIFVITAALAIASNRPQSRCNCHVCRHQPPSRLSRTGWPPSARPAPRRSRLRTTPGAAWKFPPWPASCAGFALKI